MGTESSLSNGRNGGYEGSCGADAHAAVAGPALIKIEGPTHYSQHEIAAALGAGLWRAVQAQTVPRESRGRPDPPTPPSHARLMRAGRIRATAAFRRPRDPYQRNDQNEDDCGDKENIVQAHHRGLRIHGEIEHCMR
jgi:hypothetical protein